MIRLTKKPKPFVLAILDGWGIAPDSEGNAITRANCSNFNKLWFTYPHTLLTNFGPSVGLPQGQVGNSEVGHINLGAGRIVFQDVLRIDTAISGGSFFENEAFTAAIDHSQKNNSNIHLMGLVGLGGVHSKTEHLLALLHLLKGSGVSPSRIKIHLFTDGRDSPPSSAAAYIKPLIDKINSENFGQIATVCGRYFAMDRDNRWDRTAKAYFALIGRQGAKSSDPLKAISDSYSNGVTDEFVEPVIISDASGNPVGPVKPNDSIILFNFRPDRARQLIKAFILDSLENIKTASNQKAVTFDRGPKLNNLFFVTMTEIEKDLPVSAVAFPPTQVVMPLARVFAESDLKQVHVAETEKYAHVTYFLNGGREQPFSGEDRILVNSKKVASYDQAPEMSAPEITKQVISRLNSQAYDFIVFNFANADMVAHTGNFDATVKAVEAVDFHLGIIVKATLAIGGAMMITSDHGNAEVMINPQTGQVDTEHNANPSPCLLAIGELQGKYTQLDKGILADVAPTILSVCGISKPASMTGRDLLE